MSALVVAALVLVLTSVLVLRATRVARPRERFFASMGVAIAVLASASAVAAYRPRPDVPPPAGRPLASRAPEWVTSRACLPCHAGEHASFSRTFHRTMTQDATPSAFRAPLDGRALGDGFRLVRRGERVSAMLPGGVEKPVALVTGSHREQAYWMPGERPGELSLFPFVWMVEDARFVARRDAFLLPPGAPMPDVRWASSCIACHAVAGEPRRDAVSDTWGTRVVELGIACEACHGPGRAHVERHADPFERYAQHVSRAPDATITSPKRLEPERSAALCGQCHAYAYPRDEGEWWKTGYARSFRAGDALERSRFILSPATFQDPLAPRVDAEVTGLFWPDGAVRVGGREYNGLVASPCYERGRGTRKMTCTSCHAMHAGDPSGQIAPDRRGDAACTSCHDDARARGHGHHAAGSEGNACTSCHMPRTSYALLSATRSHRIASPSVARTLATGEPNACNVCHVGETLAWTASWLERWYGTAPVPLPPEASRVAEGLRAALLGDAAVRVVVADALGRSADRSPPVALARRVLARDPYAAVRQVAARGVRESTTDATGSPDALLDDVSLRALLERRDTRPVSIAE